MNEALIQLKTEGFEIKQEDLARLSPLDFKHVNFLGKYHFDLPDDLKQGKLRPFKTTHSII